MSTSPERLHFESFELDARSGELRRLGRRLKLTGQPFEVLWLLASRAGEVVSREEIRQHVWGEDTFVDFERGLNFCILRIRRALDDDARAPRFVETLPKRGYRFIVAVEAVTAAAPPETTASETPPPAVPQARAKLWPALAVALLVAATALVTFLLSRRPEPPVVTERVLLAVLPFKNLSSEPEQDYFSDGFTEELIAQLGGLEPRRLGVIARTTIERYKEGIWDVGEIGRELGVGYIVEGSVRRDQGQVRITAQLIAVSDQTHVWAESYERNQWGALVVQRDVGRAIAQELRLELLDEGQSLPDRAGAHRPAAHEAYLKGRYLQKKRDVQELRRALKYFQEAIALDADFALPQAALAETYHELVFFGDMTPLEAYPPAREAARSALDLAPFLAEAHLAAGRVAFWFDWDWEEAERRFKKALELNPSLPAAHHDYGWYLLAMGRPESGLAEIDAARRLDPLAPSINVDTGWALIQARRYDEAVVQCRRTLELEPGLEEAELCLRWIDTLRAPTPASRARLRQRRDELLAAPESSPRNVAVHLALLGEHDAALEYLAKAVAWRSPSMTLLAVDPVFDSLHGEARFQTLVAEIGLADVWKSRE